MDKSIHLGVWITCALLIGVVFTLIAMPTKVETIASQCAAIPAVSVSCPEPIVNISDTDNGWKEQAIELATSEWSYKQNKAIYEVLRNIDEREDITKIVVKNVDFSPETDSFTQDAVVTQELKVYYENHNGEDVKVYVNVETTISNGEVEGQAITLDR